jgi:hypothetical protein
MSIDRNTINIGPGSVTFGGQTFWSKGDIVIKNTVSRFEIVTSRFGKVDERLQDKRIVVSFEPTGRFDTSLAAVIWPYATAAIGSKVFGATDSALVINTLAGSQYTLHNTALTGMPDINLGVGQTIQGEIEFTGLLKNNADPSDVNSYYTIAAVAYPGDTGFDVADIITDVFSNSWPSFGAASDFHTEDGWSISLGLSLRDEMVDGLGTVDMTFQEIQVTATAIPVGPTVDDVSLAQGINGEALGTSVQTLSSDLVIEGAGVYVAVYNAALVESDFGHGTDRKTLGSTDWIATRTLTLGVADPLFYISTAEPV